LEESISVSDEEIKAACKREGLDPEMRRATYPSGRDPEIERLVQRIRQKKKEEALEQWVKELTRTSEIKIYHEVLDGIAREKYDQ
ncbi:hypothetical protein KAW18_18210, partial [candidate division WOR-3 bacterium]|nr:hypothetical protein [candidate division WOR-3 bacterium]